MKDSTIVNYIHSFDPTREIPYQLKFNHITRNLKSFSDEVTETAKYISNVVDGPIYLFSSGGVDSEIIANELLALGIDFNVIILQFNDNTNYNVNRHDTEFAINWCKQNSIIPIIKPIDIPHFIEKIIPKYVDMGFRSKNLFNYMQLYMIDTAEELHGHAILGGRERRFTLNNNEVCFENGVWFNMCIDYCSRLHRQHYPVFYLQNPEIFASYLKLPIINIMIENPDYFKGSLRYPIEKFIEFSRLYPHMPARRKFTGYESVTNLVESVYTAHINAFPEESKSYYMPISQIKSQLGI